MALIAGGLLSFSIFVIFVGVALRASTPSRMTALLQQYAGRPRNLEEIEMSRPFSERALLPVLRGMSRLVARLTPQRNLELMSHRLDVAGNPNDWTVAEFLGVRGVVALGLAAIFVLLLFLANAPLVQLMLVAVATAVLGFYLPLFWLNLKGSSRQTRIQKQLPDVLDLLTITVEAGLGLDAAMLKVTEKWDNELSAAFGRVIGEVRVGRLRREALRDMATRADVPDLTNFVTAIIQADQLGVSIVNVLRIQSEQMRIKRRQRAEEKAHEAPIKMLLPLAFCIFPAMFVIILGPAVLRLVLHGITG
jgi:tight adherence protein C